MSHLYLVLLTRIKNEVIYLTGGFRLRFSDLRSSYFLKTYLFKCSIDLPGRMRVLEGSVGSSLVPDYRHYHVTLVSSSPGQN